MALVIYIKIHFTSCYYIVTIFVRSCGIIPRLFPSVFSSIFVENSCIARWSLSETRWNLQKSHRVRLAHFESTAVVAVSFPLFRRIKLNLQDDTVIRWKKTIEATLCKLNTRIQKSHSHSLNAASKSPHNCLCKKYYSKTLFNISRCLL